MYKKVLYRLGSSLRLCVGGFTGELFPTWEKSGKIDISHVGREFWSELSEPFTTLME